MKKAVKYSLIILLIASVIWVGFYLSSKSEKVVDTYEVSKAEIRTIIKKTVATGSIVPENETEVRPQVSGIVEKIYVEPGDHIKKGALIAKVKIIPNMLQLNGAQTGLEQAKINVASKEIVYKRQKELYESEVLPLAEFEKADVAYKLAQQDVKSAESHLQIVKEGIAKDAGVATNTLIRSTISGMVLDVPIEEGFSVIEANTFNAGTTVATIADMNKMIFEGTVDETEVGKIKQGMDLLLNVGAIDGAIFNAKLTYISPKGVEENGAIQFKIKADVELQEDFFIRSGYSANADIVVARRDSVLTIEEKNMIFEGDSIFVEIEKDTMQFEMVPIKLGVSDGIYTEVISGVDKKMKIKVQ